MGRGIGVQMGRGKRLHEMVRGRGMEMARERGLKIMVHWKGSGNDKGEEGMRQEEGGMWMGRKVVGMEKRILITWKIFW